MGYLIVFAMILIREFLDTTMFPIKWPPKSGLLFYFAIMVFVLAKLKWNNDYSRNELIMAGCVLGTFILAAILSDYSILFEIGFLLVGAKGTSFDKILGVFLIIGIAITIFAMIAAHCGWIMQLVYWTELKGMRYSLGSIYPTDYAAHLFYFVLAGTCMNNRRIHIWDVIISIACSLFVYRICGAYTSALCLMFYGIGLLIVILFQRFDSNQKIFRPMAEVGKFLPIFVAGVSIIISYLYMLGMDKMDKWNEILSSRIQYNAMAIEKYGYTIWGQMIPEIGNGRSVEIRADYFFIDNSYMRILLEYGIVIFIIVLVATVVIQKKAIKNGRITLVLAFAVMAIHCFMEHHLLEFAYNPFLLALFAELVVEKRAFKTRKVAGYTVL